MDAAQNTDREIWRVREGDYYADSIHVTAHGGIGINHGGTVIVMSLRDWHAAAKIMGAASRCTSAVTKRKDRMSKYLLGFLFGLIAATACFFVPKEWTALDGNRYSVQRVDR
jgi:hypothetical protein